MKALIFPFSIFFFLISALIMTGERCWHPVFANGRLPSNMVFNNTRFEDALAELAREANQTTSQQLFAVIASKLVTPCMPLYLADFLYLGTTDCPISGHRRPVPLFNNSSILPNGSVIHVDTSILDAFVHDYLLKSRNPSIVVLIGRYNLAGSQVQGPFTNAHVLYKMLNHISVTHVFMQNPEVFHANYEALPYGFDTSSLPTLLSNLQRAKSKNWPKSITHDMHMQVLVSPVRLSKHRRYRPDWFVGGPPTSSYWNDIAASWFVTSPGGDRYDTFRHYEILAFGALPISNAHAPLYKLLYCDDMIFIDSPASLLETLTRLQNATVLDGVHHIPNKDWLLTQFWKERVNNARLKSNGRALRLLCT